MQISDGSMEIFLGPHLISIAPERRDDPSIRLLLIPESERPKKKKRRKKKLNANHLIESEAGALLPDNEAERRWRRR